MGVGLPSFLQFKKKKRNQRDPSNHLLWIWISFSEDILCHSSVLVFKLLVNWHLSNRCKGITSCRNNLTRYKKRLDFQRKIQSHLVWTRDYMARLHYFKCFRDSVSLFQVFQSVLILYIRIILSMPGIIFFSRTLPFIGRYLGKARLFFI